MNKKYFSIITIINVVILITLSGFFPGKVHAKMGVPGEKLVKKLDKKYREWFDLVHYIITRTEKNVFLKLTNNRDRDTFINLFWNLRDPTKGTPDNEFKQEHLKRFSHASRYFKYESPLPGWKTDRGRIYIVLGPPLSKIEVNRSGLYPVEIWEYFGDVQNGLPTVFRMVFYKRGGGGGFKLYIPIVDGPASLLQTQIGQIDTNNFYKVYKKIREIDPEVSDIALTLIPGESLYDYKPSLRGPMLISKIHELPKKKINTSYAKNFLNYKGIVETSVITNYINATCDLYTIKDPLLDLNFIHIAISPERISVDYSEEKDQYYFNINLMVILNKGKNTVMQYNKDFPFYFTKQELDKKISHGMVITDHFPVVNGKFKLVIIMIV